MKWLDLAVCPKISWPNVQIEIPFEGYKVVLQPLRPDQYGKELAATISVFDHDGISFEEGGTVASRFLSRFAWSMDGGIIELWSSGSSNPTGPGRLCQGTYERSSWTQVEPWDFIYLPSARGPEADLALGLYREGMSVNSTPFAFLSYFKVMNILYSGGAGQKQWINDNLQHLRYGPAVDRLAELRSITEDIGLYLYEEGRCAVAHAHGEPLVNPDIYSDKHRMENDLKLMKELAALFIEREFGVLSDSSFWKALQEGQNLGTDLLRKIQNDQGMVEYIPEQSLV